MRLTSGGCQPVGAACTYASDPRDLASEIDPFTDTETWAVTGILNWRLTDNFTLVNITNYRELKTVIGQDLDLAATANSLATTDFNTTYQRRDVDSEQVSTELQLKYDDNERLNGVLGFFYLDETQRPVDTVGLNAFFGQAHILPVLADPSIGAFPPISATGLQIDGVNVPAVPIDPLDAARLCNTAEYVTVDPANPPAPKRVCIHSDLGTEVYALFGQANITFGDWTLKLGGRYSEEEVTASNPSIILARNGLGPVLLTTSEGTHNQKEVRRLHAGGGPVVARERGPDALLQLLGRLQGRRGRERGARRGDEFRLDHRRPGGGRAPRARAQEHLARQPARGQHCRLHVRPRGSAGQQDAERRPGGFQHDLRERSRDIRRGSGARDLCLAHGAVAAQRRRVIHAFALRRFPHQGPAGPEQYRDAGSADLPGDPTGFNPAEPEVQLAGNPTRNSPDWAWNLHGEFDFGAALGGVFTLMGDVSYKDDIYFTEFNRLLEGQDSYTIYDAQLRYASEDGRWIAELWGKNLSDEDVASSTFQLATARVIGVTYMPPRMYGLTVGYQF